MSQPDYVVCLNCETPCYVFEWRNSAVHEAFCETCGNDNPDEFISPSDLEELESAPMRH